jgi:hypothetical protein
MCYTLGISETFFFSFCALQDPNIII